jgi:hypothetical protein
MASEWARREAMEIINTNLDDPRRVPHTTAAIAEALDAARAQGRREGLEEAAKASDRISWDIGNAEFKAGARAVTAEIRALIAQEPTA